MSITISIAPQHTRPRLLLNLFLIGIVVGGVELGPIGTAATNKPMSSIRLSCHLSSGRSESFFPLGLHAVLFHFSYSIFVSS
jgi:hypothetical protein